MPRNWLSLLIGLTLLAANILSIDFDGEGFEGKGIDTTVLYVPSAMDLAKAASPPAEKDAKSHAKYVPMGECQIVSAFEAPFTLVAKFRTPSVPVLGTLLVIPQPPQLIVLSKPLLWLPVPRGPPWRPIDLYSSPLRAPPFTLRTSRA